MFRQRWLWRGVFSITLLLVAVSGIYVFSWAPSKAGRISVAKDGQFATGTYRWGYPVVWQNAVRVWSADLDRSWLIDCRYGISKPGYFSLSRDGSRLAAISPQHIVALEFDAQDGRLLNELPFPDSVLVEVAYGDNDGAIYCIQGIWNQGKLQLYRGDVASEEVEIVAPPQRTIQIDPSRRRLLRKTTAAGDERLTIQEDGQEPKSIVVKPPPWQTPSLSSAPSRRETTLDIELGTHWTATAQHLATVSDEMILRIGSIDGKNETVIRFDGDVDRVAKVMNSESVSLVFDDRGERLLYHAGRTVRVIDVAQGKVIATKKLAADDMAQSAVFQDADHLLIVSSADALDNDQISRWNWRTDQTVTRSAGAFSAATIESAKWAIPILFCVWFVVFAWDGRKRRSAFRPLIDVGTFLLVTGFWFLAAQLSHTDSVELVAVTGGITIAGMVLVCCWGVTSEHRLGVRVIVVASTALTCTVFLHLARTDSIGPLVHLAFGGGLSAFVVAVAKKFGWTMSRPEFERKPLTKDVPRSRWHVRDLMVLTLIAALFSFVLRFYTGGMDHSVGFVKLLLTLVPVPTTVAIYTLWTVLGGKWLVPRLIVWGVTIMGATRGISLLTRERYGEQGAVFCSLTFFVVGVTVFVAAWMMRWHGIRWTRSDREPAPA